MHFANLYTESIKLKHLDIFLLINYDKKISILSRTRYW